MVLITPNPGRTFRAHPASSVLDYTTADASIGIAPVVVSETNGDAIVNKNTSSGTLPGLLFVVDAPVNDFDIVNQTESKLDQLGNVLTAKVGATGLGEVLLRNREGASSLHRFSVAQTGASVTYDLTGFSEGTIGEEGFALIEAALATGGDLEYYNGASFAACEAAPGGIQRNPACWGADWDLSGVAVQYINSGFNGGGCLVTPRHYIASNHYRQQNKVGWTLKFVGASGEVYSRTILAQTEGHDDPSSIANPVWPVGDTVMFLLDSALPEEDVAIYPIVGNWIYNAAFVEDNEDGTADYDVEWTYPVITTNQNRHLLFGVCNYLFDGYTRSYPLGNLDIDGESVAEPLIASAHIRRGPLYQADTDKQAAAVSGDSGSVWFLPLPDGSLAAISHYTNQNTGPLYDSGILNAMILEVDTNAGVSTELTVTVAPDPTL